MSTELTAHEIYDAQVTENELKIAQLRAYIDKAQQQTVALRAQLATAENVAEMTRLAAICGL